MPSAMETRRYYACAISADVARTAILRWLQTGPFCISDSDRVRVKGLRLVYIAYCCVAVQFQIRWQGMIGTVDRGAWSMAINTYSMAVSHFESMPDHARRYAQPPIRPNARDFLHWMPGTGRIAD